MENKTITMYELIGLIKDDKAPKKIKIDNDIWYFVKRDDENYYIDKEEYCFDCCQLGFDYYIEENKLDTIVEILPEENEMKEMIYKKDRKIEILYHGFYKDYEFYIMNLGIHPTAYVNVIDNKLLAMKDYHDIDINVHGGLTYSENKLYINDKREKVSGWFIGWDYGHYNDYAGYEMNLPEEIRSNGKKWTTEEIFKDVKNVIEQCINYIEENKEKQIDEWEDIEELEQIISSKAIYDNYEDITKDIHNIVETIDNLVISFNQLIKNQKYLKERLDKDER